jgi:hypothetical protein
VIPSPHIGRFVGRDRERSSNDLAPIGKGTNLSRTDKLHEDIPHRRGLDRPGENRSSAGIGRELAEQRVSCPPAHDMNRLQAIPDNGFQSI